MELCNRTTVLLKHFSLVGEGWKARRMDSICLQATKVFLMGPWLLAYQERVVLIPRGVLLAGDLNKPPVGFYKRLKLFRTA